MLNRRHFNHGYEFIKRFFRGFNLEQAIKLGTLLSVLYGISFGLNQLSILQEGQITDRYIKSIELLESEQMEVRHGAIYALARIAKDSPDKDGDYVKEVLESYFRTRMIKWTASRAKEIKMPSIYKYSKALSDINSLLPSKVKLIEAQEANNFIKSTDSFILYNPRQSLPMDLQGALKVINTFHDKDKLKLSVLDQSNIPVLMHTLPNFSMLDFYYAFLRGVDLSGYDLSYDNFLGAMIGQSDFSNSYLTKSTFKNAYVYQTSFSNSYANDVSFENTILHGSSFEGAFLERSNFQNADLTRVNFKNANLCNADLRGAQFAALVKEDDGTFTFENEAQGLTVKQIECSRWDESTVWPSYILEALAKK